MHHKHITCYTESDGHVDDVQLLNGRNQQCASEAKFAEKPLTNGKIAIRIEFRSAAFQIASIENCFRDNGAADDSAVCLSTQPSYILETI